MKAEHEATLAYVRRPVGKTSAPLHSYFALVADDPSVQIVSAGADLVHRGDAEGRPSTRTCRSCRRPRPSRPAAAAAPDYYTDVPAGDVAIKNVADLYLYPNTVQAVAITGAQVKEWLEMSAGIFNQIEPGKADQPLINPDFPSYNFDVIDGVTYRIDLSQPPKYDPKGDVLERRREPHRRPDVRRQADRSGAEIRRRDQQLPRRRRRQFPGDQRFEDDLRGARHQPRRDRALHRRAGHHQPVGRRQLVVRRRCHGTTVIFETGPKAKDHHRRREGVKIEPAGEGADGFAKYRITL